MYSAPGKFNVNGDGEVFELYRDGKGRGTIAKFDGSGKNVAKIALDERFSPEGDFGIFKSGEILVAATEVGDRKKPFTAVFDKNGKMVKRVDFSDDTRILEAIKTHDEGFVRSDQDYHRNAAIGSGSVAYSSDGNLYVLRHTTPAIVYTVSPSGQVVNRFEVESGEPALVPYELFERDGQLAIVFGRRSQGGEIAARLMVVNAKTGESLRAFDAGDDLGVAVVCFEPPDQFTFVGSSEDKFALKRAKP